MSSSKLSPLILTLIFLVSIIPVLGLPQISGSSEAREAHVAHIIRSTNEWILPNRNGFVPSKPLLHHWLTVLTSTSNGAVNEFSSRLPSAILGVLVLIAVFLFSRRVFRLTLKNPLDAEFHALVVTLILTTTYGFFRMLFLSMVDMTFAAFVVFSLLVVMLPIFEQTLEGKDSPKVSQISWALFFVFCGLATLAKGPLGLILPILIMAPVLVSLFGGRKALMIAWQSRWSCLIYPVLALPWYLLAKEKAQSAFVERQLLFENVKRFFGGDHINSEPFWYYVPSFLMKTAPWSFVFFALIIWFLKSKSDRSASHRICSAILLGILTAVVFFSISSGKRHSYLLPLFPIMAFVGVWTFSQWSATLTSESLIKIRTNLHLLLKTVVFLISFIVLLIFAFMTFGPSLFRGKAEVELAAEWLRTNYLLFSFAPLLALFVLAVSSRKDLPKEYSLWAYLFVFCSFFSSMISVSFGVKAAYRDYPGMAKVIESSAMDREIVAVRNRFDELLDPIFFYIGQPLRVVDPIDLASACKQDVLFITRRSNLQGIPPNITVVEENVLREKVGKPKSLEDRAVSLFKCTPGSNSNS